MTKQEFGRFYASIPHGGRNKFISFIASKRNESEDKWKRCCHAWSEGRTQGRKLSDEEAHELGMLAYSYKMSSANG